MCCLCFFGMSLVLLEVAQLHIVCVLRMLPLLSTALWQAPLISDVAVIFIRPAYSLPFPGPGEEWSFPFLLVP